MAGTKTDRRRANPGDRCGIDLFLAAIAVDHCPRDILDDGAEAGRDRPPAEPVDQRVLEGNERIYALRRVCEQFRVLVGPGMGHGNKQREGTARRVNRRSRVAAHVQQSAT